MCITSHVVYNVMMMCHVKLNVRDDQNSLGQGANIGPSPTQIFRKTFVSIGG